MINPSWGTKRNCPSCSVHFYDLNKMPVSCPKCAHEFDPSVVARAKRKPVRREAPEAKKDAVVATVLAARKPAARKKDKKEADMEGTADGGISDIAELEDVDDIESLKELSELEEMEEVPVNGDDADDEAIIDDLGTGGKALVGNVEEEEASALGEELDEEEEESAPRKKTKTKKK